MWPGFSNEARSFFCSAWQAFRWSLGISYGPFSSFFLSNTQTLALTTWQPKSAQARPHQPAADSFSHFSRGKEGWSRRCPRRRLNHHRPPAAAGRWWALRKRPFPSRFGVGGYHSGKASRAPQRQVPPTDHFLCSDFRLLTPRLLFRLRLRLQVSGGNAAPGHRRAAAGPASAGGR